MKLLFYIPGLVDGGAERVMSTLATHCALRGHDVIFAVEFLAEKNCAPLHETVKLIGLAQGHAASLRHLSSLLRVERPDIAISAIASCSFKLTVASLMARFSDLFGFTHASSRTRIVLTYHGFEEYKTGWLSWLGTVSLALLSRIADKTVAVSSSMLEDLATRWKAKRAALVLIYNPVHLPEPPQGFCPPKTAQDLKKRENFILSAGRLGANKRFDLLVRALARLDDPTATLTILGDGPERQHLLQLASQLGVSSRLFMPGFVHNTGDYYARAKCFILASTKESFGLVLVEALAYGLPVLVTNRGGPPEILEQGKYGTLMGKDPTDLEIADRLNESLSNPGDPTPRIRRAATFDVTTGVQQYMDLFDDILHEAN